MKIAILSFYSGINQRGVERWVYELVTRLSTKHSITVYQGGFSDSKTSYKKISLNVNYQRDKSKKGGLLRRFFVDYDSIQVFRFTIGILKSLFVQNYDIVIPTDGGWEPAFVRILTWIRRKKMIIVGHAGIGCDDANNLWSFPDTFVALSTFAEKWAKKVNPFVKTVYIPDAVNTEVFNPSGTKTSLPLKKPVAICVAALEKGKRIDLVIKAASKVKGLSLLVCGRGEEKEELLKMGKDYLKEGFELRDYDFNEMPSVYRSCDVFLSASLPHYSFEMVLLEAMACGLPVVANNDEIRKEIVGNAGKLVDVADTGQFSEAIQDVLDKDWKDLPRKRAESFSWDKITESYFDLFRNVVKS